MRAPVVNAFTLVSVALLFFAPTFSTAQDLRATIQAMKLAYASSGSIVVQDNDSIVIEPRMPSPICGLLMKKDGKAVWAYYTFPLASITVPLASVDESLIVDNRVFTDPDVARRYKPGDTGDATMVVIAGLPGKEFHTLIYDRDKFAQLGPGPHSSREYGQASDNTTAFGLTFSDPEAAHTFESALKEAVILARSKLASR